MICTLLINVSITFSAYRTLNSCCGIISEPDIQYVPETELLENLKDQKVIEVKRIYIHKNNEKISTKHIILTFASTRLPRSLKAGYLECPIRAYIPNPLRCFNCQRFGHSKTSCRGKTTCARCGVIGHESQDCEAPFCCVNCHQEHPSYSKICKKWKIEKEIQTVRTQQNISYTEARKIVDNRSPTVGISYAAATERNLNKKIYKSIETRTDFCSNNITEIQKPKENANNIPKKLPQAPKISQPVSSKLPLHRRNKPNTPSTQTTKTVRKSSSEKNLPSIKSSINSSNPHTKKLKEQPKTEKKKKVNSIQNDHPLLSLHPTDSSGNEDDMSINSDEGNTDIYI